MVIHYDPWWNVAAERQASDRAHRIGQSRVVSVYRIIAKNTIEERIVTLQKSKERLADNILNGETISLGSLSKKELLSILDY
jgi:SNF2 family DNA or RNA helicase